MFAGATVPSGWLECNGQAAPSALAAVLGQANVPDLRGEFIRGWDNGRGVDAGRILGSAQDDEFKAHNHPGSSVAKQGGAVRVAPGSSDSYGSGIIASDGGVETRPRNVALMYIIKT
jgi:phage-related tail fiber protein